MTVTLGTTTVWNCGGCNLPNQTFINNGENVVFLGGARSSTDHSPAAIWNFVTYDGVSIPEEELVGNGRCSMAMGQLFGVSTGSYTLVASHNSYWDTHRWSATAVSGIIPSVYDSHSNSDWASPLSLTAAVATANGGVAFCLCAVQTGGIATPSGWTQLFTGTYTEAFYMMTDGTSVQPAPTHSGLNGVIGVVSFAPLAGGSKMILVMSSLYKRIQENRKKLGVGDLGNFGLSNGLCKPTTGLATI